MLNGQRLSVANAASAIKFKTLAAPGPTPAPDTDDEEAEEAEEILVADAGPIAEQEFEQGDATPTSFDGATVVIPAGRPAFTVSEYEARQFAQ
tara:strand:+ start:39 stop:317 length:279 start_codon:yes stop_codon:yes gene_type:complete